MILNKCLIPSVNSSSALLCRTTAKPKQFTGSTTRRIVLHGVLVRSAKMNGYKMRDNLTANHILISENPMHEVGYMRSYPLVHRVPSGLWWILLKLPCADCQLPTALGDPAACPVILSSHTNVHTQEQSSETGGTCVEIICIQSTSLEPLFHLSP
jgi:hypothetical protein